MSKMLLVKKAKETLEKELANIKGGGSASPDTSSITPGKSATEPASQQNWDLGPSSQELDKTFALLRERVTSPKINLAEVSMLISRMEKSLKSVK